MMWRPSAHPLTEHGSGRVAPFDAHARGNGGRRSRHADDERKTVDRLEALAAYARAWSLTDEGEIRAELARCWTASSTHVNPFTDTVCGLDAVTKLILDFPAMFPGATVRLTSVPDLHHDAARFSWRLQSTASIRILGRDFGFSVEGLNYAEFDQENRIRRVIVFYGPLVSPFEAPRSSETRRSLETPAPRRPIGTTRPGTEAHGTSGSQPRRPAGQGDLPHRADARSPGWPASGEPMPVGMRTG
jgi:hypothetical protein